MPITYTWTPSQLVGYPQYEGQTDVITNVFYTVVADDGEGHTASTSAWQQTPIDPAAPYIPYNELTPEIIIGWVQFNLGPDGVASIYANLDALIAAQTTPPPEPQQFPLPWNYGQTPSAPSAN